MISKSKVDKTGELLKAKQRLSTKEYQDLLSWRNGHTSILDYYHTKLKAKIDNQDIVSLARRLKRIESIQIKLMRFKTMRLSTLQDVAGLRVVLTDEIALQKAFSKLRSLPSRHLLKRVDNYHNTPKADGYRSFHLIYQNDENLQVEVQLRTKLEHIWATAVEIYGELQQTSFKTGSGDQRWQSFFALLSSYFAIKENCTPTEEHKKLSEKQIRSQLKKMIKHLDVIEKLNAYTNSIEIVTTKYNDTGRQGKYAILELDLISKVTKVDLFTKKDLQKAIEIYTQKELDSTFGQRKNVVLVNVDDMKKIQKTYPNYFLDTKDLLEILARIVLDDY